MDIYATLTQHTCSIACWLAEEHICSCSCGGVNHGILLKEGGKQPQRMARINGKVYLLFSIGKYYDIWNIADNFNKLYSSYEADYFGKKVVYYMKETQPNAPARVKPASKQQIKTWGELKGKYEAWNRPSLLWIRQDLKDKYEVDQ